MCQGDSKLLILIIKSMHKSSSSNALRLECVNAEMKILIDHQFSASSQVITTPLNHTVIYNMVVFYKC